MSDRDFDFEEWEEAGLIMDGEEEAPPPQDDFVTDLTTQQMIPSFGPSPKPTETKPLHKSRYGALAYDLILQVADLPAILESYEIDEEMLSALLDSPSFQKTYKDCQREVNELGGFAVRARALAEDMLGGVSQIARGEAVSPETRHKIFMDLATLGRLNPAVENRGKDRGGGVNVIINIPQGVRGLEHLSSGITVEAEEQD